MVNWQVSYRLGVRQSNIDGNPAASVLFEFQPSPTKNAPTSRTEMYFEGWVRCADPGVNLTWTADPNALAFIIICPKRAVTAT